MISKFLNSNKVESLKTKSNNIFNVFTQTLDQLNSVNIEIDNEITDRNQKIAKLQEESNSLKATGESNDKMIIKINSFINE